jgi:hypothetical protein
MHLGYKIGNFIKSPWTGIVIAMLLAVLAWKMNSHIANFLLILAELIFVCSVFFVSDLKKRHIEVRVLWTLVIGLITCWCIYVFLWSPEKTNEPDELVKTQSLEVSDPVKSPTLQIGTASNVMQQVDYSTRVIAQTNSGQVEGQIVGPDHISITQNFYNNGFSNVPDVNLTRLRERVSNIETKVETESTNINLTQGDILALTSLLKKIDERTADIQRLPDGRTSLGGVIAMGSPQYEMADATAAQFDYNSGDFHGAYNLSLKAISKIENTQSNWVWEVTYPTAQEKSSVYYLAGLSAERIESNDFAYKFAEKAFDLFPNDDHKMLLVSSLGNRANGEALHGDFTNALALYNSAITNFESIKTIASNDVPHDEIILL